MVLKTSTHTKSLCCGPFCGMSVQAENCEQDQMYKRCFQNYCLITACCLTLKHKLKSTEHCRNSKDNKKGWKGYFTKLTTYAKPWSFSEKHTHIKVNTTDIIKIQRSKYIQLLYHTLLGYKYPCLHDVLYKLGRELIFAYQCVSHQKEQL